MVKLLKVIFVQIALVLLSPVKIILINKIKSQIIKQQNRLCLFKSKILNKITKKFIRNSTKI